MSNTVDLPWGDEKLTLDLPGDWSLLGVMEPAAIRGVPDVCAEVERSLGAPIGMPRLSQLVDPEMKIALVMDDDSRPTPVAKIMPALLSELRRGGVTPDRITVVPALGLHRAMSEAEIAWRIGKPSISGMHQASHDCDDPDELAFLGATGRGTPVYINRTVAEADFVISVGCIEPHIIAGAGGGYKNILPGVAGRATIAHNHSLNCRPGTFNNVGQPIERNPMRLDLEEAAAMLEPPVFVVNAVLNSRLEVVRVVCGHAVQAHRAGFCTSAEIYGARVPAMADVVVTSSHPMDQDLRQGVKALANTIRALKPGGVMITLVRASEGVGVFGLANARLPVGRRGLQLLAPLLLPLIPKLKLKGLGEEDRFFLYFALQAMLRGELLMIAPTIPADVKAHLPFVVFMDSLELALARARKKFPGKASVLVFPHGGSTYPILPE